MSSEKTPPENSDEIHVCVLASGSRGNAIYISDGEDGVLVDAGLSGKKIEHRMQSRDLRMDHLRAIIVSHEHSDHIQGVGVLSRRYKLPVYISAATYARSQKFLGRLEQVHHFECGKAFVINGMTIHPFSTSHDAEDPAGFTIRQNGIKIGIATDLGIATTMVKEHLKGVSLLVIEANHDPKMLVEGPYPWPLKQRIKGRSGHLSNENTMSLIREIQDEQLQHVILAHLSEQNNRPEIALEMVKPIIDAGRTTIHIAAQDACTKVVRLV
ncbi:MAG: MBL fold metallo-hydrolase [Desulfobacteraceae bacterium]|nr:MBL fold metallo-hydrolase [Desulfobacteraceae bacterium]